jgi:hypothetical protein
MAHKGLRGPECEADHHSSQSVTGVKNVQHFDSTPSIYLYYMIFRSGGIFTFLQ